MKKIEDYLKHYIGCDVIYTPPESASLKVKLVGFTRHEEGIIDVTLFESDNDDGYEGFGYRHDSIDYIELLLRPLSSMTEEEGAYIGEIVYGKPDSVKWRTDHCKGYVNIYRKHYSNHLCIDHASGDVDFYDDNETPGTSIHTTEIFRYLLTKGFDVFGLIEDCLALDSTLIEKV